MCQLSNRYDDHDDDERAKIFLVLAFSLLNKILRETLQLGEEKDRERGKMFGQK